MKIGLLPFYLALYDQVHKDLSENIRKFTDVIAGELARRGFDVVPSPACRFKDEFQKAVSLFEASGCQAIATLHLAYSPSLEAADALAGTSLPIVVIDTTPTWAFGGPADIMPNHGIHGVQDFCNLMLRRNKPFLLATGHWQNSPCLDEAADCLRAAGMAWRMSHIRVGQAGGDFPGMGDFQVPDGTFGMETVQYTPQPAPTEEEIDRELALDRERFDGFENVNGDALRRTLRESLKLRRWIEKENLQAFTICFLGIERSQGWETVPFLECSKAIARGIGYAGEGDKLTAAMTRCLADVFPQVSFTEMFCPDWKNDRIFTSHMGEINLNLCSAKPLLHETKYALSDTGAPVIATGCFKGGHAALVNLAPGPDGSFTLITARIGWEDRPGPSPESNSGWFKPEGCGIREFLKRYSLLGGTHHLATVYAPEMDVLQNWACLMGWKYASCTDV